MKTLDFLKCMRKDTPCEWSELDESIAELEALQQHKSCDGCKCWDSVEFSIIKTLSYCRFLNTGTKNTFYCSEFEAKGAMR